MRIHMTPVDLEQRKIIVCIAAATLLMLGVAIADLATGGRPDPQALRAAATLLNGPWRFQTGDDPQWADPNTDDSSWEMIDLTAAPGSHDGDVGLPDYVGGWMSHGHAGYHGYAWYRRAVNVPAGPLSWGILGPTFVEDGYELYWNGTLLGGSGKLGANPRVVGTRPMQFTLPSNASGTRGVLAIRTYKLPGGSSADGGGIHSAPILAPLPLSDQLHRVQWQRTIAGYILEVIEPLAMLAVVGLAMLIRTRSTHRSFLILTSLALVLMAERRLNNAIVAWTDLMDIRTYASLATVMWIPILAAWTLAWNRWSSPAWRSIDIVALVLAILAVIGVFYSPELKNMSRLGSILVFVIIGIRIARSGPMRVLALLAFMSVAASQFAGELLDPLGIPGIWFPFGIGVSRIQYIYAIAIPLLAFLITKTFQPRDLKESNNIDTSR